MNDRRPRLLVTGFGAFPGAPVNPSAALVRRLARRRRSSLADLDFSTAVLPVTWSGLPIRLDRLLAGGPDAIVLFGLAASAPRIRIERIADDRAIDTHPDADGVRHGTGRLADGHTDRQAGPLAAIAYEAIASTGTAVDYSDDAGGYLCNAALWQVLGTPHPAVFVHLPLADPAVLLAPAIAVLRAVAAYATAR